MRVSYYALALDQVPADFFADPDGAWSYELLARAAGFASHSGVAIGALRSESSGYPEGAAVVHAQRADAALRGDRRVPITYDYLQEPEQGSASSAA